MIADFPESVIVGDFNNDHKLDLVVAIYDDRVSDTILLGNGNGTFQNAVIYSTGSASFSVAAGDFDNDNKLDLALIATLKNNVNILLGNGNGTFQYATTYPVGDFPMFVLTGDFNNDTKLDLLTVNQGDDSVSILFGNGDGTFQQQTTASAGDLPIFARTGDFNIVIRSYRSSSDQSGHRHCHYSFKLTGITRSFLSRCKQ